MKKATLSGLLGALIFFGVTGSFATESNTTVLRKVWKIGSSSACTKDARARFNELNFEQIRSQLESKFGREQLKFLLNPFLKSLGWSHTEFLTRQDESFYLFRAHASSIHPGNPPPPKIINPGVQLGQDSDGYFVREVLTGFPAHQKGIYRNDRILSWRGKAFRGSWGAGPAYGNLVLKRGPRRIMVSLSTLELNWNNAFLDATKKSEQIFRVRGKRIGYVRLWTGVHKDSAATLQKIVVRLSAKADGLILDLRGGYGGAWWEHLDPFFKNRDGFFQAEVLNGDDESDVWIPEPNENENAYLGPLVVLVNEGSRSGKEALAYQFKRSRRATLVGTKTAGYFSAGGFYFTDESVDYVLYLCTLRIALDGNPIEGIGIAPEIEIPFSSSGKLADSQLEAALELLAR